MAGEGSGFLKAIGGALLGTSVIVGSYYLHEHWQDLLSEIESLESENKRLKGKIGELSPGNPDGLRNIDYETSNRRT